MRTRIGPFTLEQAIDPRTLSRETIRTLIRPPLEAVAHLRKVVIDAAAIEAVIQGKTIALPERLRPARRASGELVALLDQDSRLVALAEPDFDAETAAAAKGLIVDSRLKHSNLRRSRTCVRGGCVDSVTGIARSLGSSKPSSLSLTGCRPRLRIQV